MELHEHVALLVARERIGDAVQAAEQARVIRLARGPHASARVRLGNALVRLGEWMMGQHGQVQGRCLARRTAEARRGFHEAADQVRVA